MSASPVAYFFGILFALPVWILVGVLAVMTVRLFIQWLVDDGSVRAAKLKGEAKAALKG